jgi:two-component system, NarL family, response regulator NreC
MIQISFLIATHSFTINKGLTGILKEFRNVGISEIVENIDAIEIALRNNKPNYLVISSDLLSEMDSLKINQIYKLSPTTEIIHFQTNDNKQLPIQHSLRLTMNAGKKETIEFFAKLIDKKLSGSEIETSELSEREKDILGNVAMGKTNKEIADELNISIHTVITHRKNITAKLGIKSISGLTVYAIFNGIISMDDVEY